MLPQLIKHCENFEREHDLISKERQNLLTQIANTIEFEIKNQGNVQLIYICTHNSRRSHFGQIWANVLAEFYGISSQIEAFSGGTEVTALHTNSITALKRLGFEITSDTAGTNPRYIVKYGENLSTICFSKVYDNSENPQKDVLAIMTCSHADENCPFIPGAKARFATPYEDPKLFDATELQDQKYLERALEIGREISFMMQLVGSKKDNTDKR